MSFTAGDLIKEVYAYWNRPAESDLQQNDIISVLNRKVNRLLLEMQITDRNYLAVLSDTFTFNGDEMTREMNDFPEMSSIVRVESRSLGSDEMNWTEEVITDYGSWNDVMDSPIDSVAFFGTGQQLQMAVNREVPSLEFRILYETGGVSLTAFGSTVPSLQDLFRGLVFYGMAAEAGMMIDNLNAEGREARNEKVAYATAQEAQNFQAFRRWLLNEPGQAVSYREAFNSMRIGHGTARMHPHNQLGGYYSRY